MVYWNPWVLLRSWEHLRNHNWPALEEECRKMSALVASLFARFGPRGFTDTAYHRLGGRVTGFLQTSLRNRGPYASPNEDDIALFRGLLQEHYPEMLEGAVATCGLPESKARDAIARIESER